MAVTKVRTSAQVLVDLDFDHNNKKITNLADPVNPLDGANRQWVLAQIAGGISSSLSCKAATTANITLSATQTVDGVALVVGDYCLVKNQTTPATNGVYVVASGGWTRHASMDAWSEVPGVLVSVQQGTLNGDTLWLSTADAGGTLGSTAITFTQMPGPSDIIAGAGLVRTGQQLDIVTNNSLVANADQLTTNGAVVLHKADFIVRETPSGTINGSNTTFGLASSPYAGGEMLYLNGLLQEPGAGNDYTISGQTITFLTAPATGDRLRAIYVRGAAPVTPN